ncbi:adenylate/guanylate cyclase domain-containing protein [Sphingomonas mesophila]|uniref:adenylate/guanylate cyclase domain-containing protein n=1 Tax=Sphingomonas mesophila TaxID=2303576 RepID=UPI000E58B2A4|nr:adenylate/guanylate cyclase domain-containing protein [Sphingomonas mesophila]
MSFADRLLAWTTDQSVGCGSIPDLIGSFCALLNREGFAIRRCNLLTETVHPLMANSRHVWFDRESDPGPINPVVVVSRARHDLADGAMIDAVFFNVRGSTNPQYLTSPFHQVDLNGELCRTIGAAGQAQAFPLFDDLAALGCTAYYADRLHSFSGLSQKLGLATDRPDGFADRLPELRSAIAAMSMQLNTLVERDTKQTLARVYLGDDPGERACAGMIHAGDVVSLDAAIWFSDLRGFTAGSHGVSSERLIERLNDYFGTVAGPIYAQGGEILKFIGDAVLAVFPVGEGGPRAACRAALAALERAGAELGELNRRFGEAGEEPLEHGVGLHLGTVSYGNIGSSERLDFTVIGPAVNLASRIEGMCKELGQSVLMSSDFAAAAGIAGVDLGRHALKGIAEPVALFAPDWKAARG